MVHCSVCLLPIRFPWNLEGRRSQLTLRQRRELREGSLTAALLWSLGSGPVVPSSGCRRTRTGVVSVKIVQLLMELRSKPTSSNSPSPGRLETHKPLCGAPPFLTGARSKHITSSDPNLFGNASNLTVGSSSMALFRSSFSLEKKFLPPYPLPMARGVSSGLCSSVCFSSSIILSSCGAVSTGPEDASEITSVSFVDGVWTSTAHYVTIFPLSDCVAKALPTHSSIVSNSLSSSCEDLSYLAYLSAVVYAYCLRRWIIPSCYCIEEV
ncbi:hypothetical protein Bca52824_003865 [Brassica carinata]|uniref:Uncharacterized protein n=1 Tax=Brassica carinata TaxID=52824 RepID=A0A8X7WPK9_BRACI|nr:hypothetical protein Bca52824_003865 [Brassica carinata]